MKYISRRSKKTWLVLATIVMVIYSTRSTNKGFAKQTLKTAEFEQSNCYLAFSPKNIDPNLKLESHPSCSKKDWVIIDSNGILTYNAKFLAKQGITIKSCSYQAIRWSEDDFSFDQSEPIAVSNNSQLNVNENFFRIKCKSTNRLNYNGVFARIFKPKVANSPKKQPINVLMLGFDSVSREDWLTYLSKSSDYLVSEMNGTVILNGYNIMGDGTPAALIPILTSKHENELPNAIRGSAGVQFVDKVYPFIWEDFERRLDYATLWNEDWPHIGTFQYRLSGMSEPPTTHYSRPFQLACYRAGIHEQACHNGRTNFQLNNDYIQDFMDTYKHQGFFGISFLNSYTHNSNEKLAWVDANLTTFLQTFNSDKALSSSTILILFSDHGPRFSANRKSMKGLLHERNPFVSIRLPELFKIRYRKEYNNLIKNANKLATPLDIHATLTHLIDLETKSTSERYISQVSKGRDQSLFKRISSQRNCAQAGIQPHWCACLKRTEVKVDENMVRISQQFVNYLNREILANHLDVCHDLKLYEISKIFLMDTFINSELAIKLKKEKGFMDRLMAWRYLQEPPVEVDYKKYLFQVTVKPSMAIYEFTVTVERKYSQSDSSGDDLTIESESISRINAYGDTSHCIQNSFPDLRKYCYCRAKNKN